MPFPASLRFFCATACLAFLPATAAVSAMGPFQHSCRNMTVTETMLTADCMTRDGGWVRSSLALQGIENRDGVLSYRPGQHSTFLQSCNAIWIKGDILSAQCRTNDGQLRSTRLRLQGIDNVNGMLHYAERLTDAAPAEHSR